VTWTSLVSSPLFGIAITLAAYSAARALHARAKWAHPLVATCAILIAVLRYGHIRLEDYSAGGDYIAYLLGPATVALGVPMYKHARALKRSLPALSIGVAAGSAVGLVTVGVTAVLLGAPRQLVMSMLPKSVTTPIAIEIARQLHGLPEMAAGLAVVTGLVGSIVGPALLRSAGVSHDLAVGAAIGTAAHGIGTARLAGESEIQASASSLSMALAGIATSVLAVPVPWIVAACTWWH
jgi:predicted murein hydrolase (TIGR00659 family)